MPNTAPPIFRYPANVGQPPVDKWILFEAKKGRHIIRSGITPGDTTLAACALYLPEGALRTSIAANWDAQDVGTLLGSAIELTGDLGQKLLDTNINNLSAAAESIKTALAKVTGTSSGDWVDLGLDLIKAEVLTHFAGEFGAGVGAATGRTVNPKTDMVFTSVPFRSHEFDFMLVPRNVKEAKDIDNIVKFFQYYMLPSFGKGGLAAGAENLKLSSFMIGYPHEFVIQMRHSSDLSTDGGKKLQHVNRIGRSVLKNCTVDHATTGKVSFIKDGNNYYPTATKISLQFDEVRLLGRDSEEVLRPEDDGTQRTTFADKLD